MQSSDPEFRVWVRRVGADPAPFSLRFTVTAGRGTLVLPRTAGTAAAPAAPADDVDGLTAADLGATRFLVVPDGGIDRFMYDLGPFEADDLDTLPDAQWTALDIMRGPDSVRLVLLVQVPDIELRESTRRVTVWSPPPRHETTPTRKLPTTAGLLSVPTDSAVDEHTAFLRITELEAALEEATRRTAQLTERVAGLEHQVETLGGTVSPLEDEAQDD